LNLIIKALKTLLFKLTAFLSSLMFESRIHPLQKLKELNIPTRFAILAGEKVKALAITSNIIIVKNNSV
jgi:hypothetical protein